MRGCVVRLPGSLRLRAWLHVASWRLLALEVVVLAWAGMSGRLLRLALRWQVAPRRLVLDQAENYRICSAPAHPCSSRDSSLVVSLFSDSRRLMLEYCRQGMTLGDRGKPMSETVLITGAFGQAGEPTVAQFAADGWQVVATAHRKIPDHLPDGVTIAPVDLSDPAQVERLVSEVKPAVIVHLAAVIPPHTYRDPALARKVNVDATEALVRAAEAQRNPPRFLHASSCAVFGPRNPYRQTERLGNETPVRPCEHYGVQKLEAEQIVRSSDLDWVVLRLGSIVSIDPAAMPFTADVLYFGSALPHDARLHTVDARDVACAFVAAATAEVVGEILFIGGDDSHLLRAGEFKESVAAARGLVGFPVGRPGDPESDIDWYATGDWMDVARAQQALEFHHHSWPDMLVEMRDATGWKYYPTRLMAPLARVILKRQSAYRNAPGQYADVWGAIRARLGEPTATSTAEPS